MARILVVDDEEGIREFLADVLELAGHDVARAEDGQAALDLLDKRAFQLLITDLTMPRLDGMGLLARARAEHPDMECVVLTAHGTVDTAVDAMKAGAFDYLQKPLRSPAELRALVDRALERHRLCARQEAQAPSDGGVRLTWGAPSMERAVGQLRKVAATDSTVLLLGESGVGKEVTARAVHRWSRRADGPFVVVNCAALSDSLLESELFGHEKGAFTGAAVRKRGKLELADGGTFFLDEVGELKPELQARLLRAIQERCFERVGGTQTVSVDVRWIAATNRDLAQRVAEGAFREDLYFRLAVFPVQLPPLRERTEDIVPLARQLLRSRAADVGRPGLTLSAAAEAQLMRMPWKGNVRELANCLERAAILAEGEEIGTDDLSPAFPGAAQAAGPVVQGVPTLDEVEREAIRRALTHFDGNRRLAAEHLGIGERTLYDRLKKYDLS
ncbi:MAG: sigma-54-dependent Fis family transcriptional regulator [Alphaproteobacteria bacterium]|nr:sigma-54-dependent Fis family transcriptional regulator [Alphaproteobacteria bacterium]